MTNTGETVDLVEAIAHYAVGWRLFYMAEDEGHEHNPPPMVPPLLIEALSERGGEYLSLFSDRSQVERFLVWYERHIR
jgi:hypothetical protein